MHPLSLQDQMKLVIEYDPLKGEFHWKRHRGRVAPGKLAGNYTDGRCRIRMNGELWKGQDLAWLLAYGYVPDRKVRFINGDRQDLRLSNLEL